MKRLLTPIWTCLRLGALAALALSGAGDAAAEDEFPTQGWMPKTEIGADRFIHANPAYDGRGVVVAVFDSGVDPGAPGLQTTTDGKPKIVDLVDGSGSGDVDTSVVRKAKGGKLAGLSGRTLTLGPDLTCPKNEWHVGLKPAFEFFPRGLVRRLTRKRRKGWDAQQRVAEAALQAALAGRREPAVGEERKDLEQRLEHLRAMQKDYEDPGPIYDCVVFHDGEVWRAVIDTDEDGDLGDEKALASYRLEGQWSTFSAEDRLNYGVNVYGDGDLLSIVVDAGAHGTHVAGIVAAHFPDRPEMNGIAPGAQIVAVKIGDTRMGSNSMGTGEERGIVAVMRNRCDLINMSYGGPSVHPKGGRTERLYTEIINKHHVIFVASAGNEGPGLSTVGSPGGTASALFGVGAYVSPEMMKAQHALRKTVPPVHYTWSARGPTLDGDLGVDFSAPGGAVAPVPNWSLQGGTHMSGTSMSSPNLCGGIALLLSGLKGEGIPVSPHRVRRALSATARQVEGLEVFALGRGLVQIPEAFDYARRWKDRPDEDVRYEVTLPDRGDARGLYLREPFEVDRVVETRVRVKPHLQEKADHERRIQYQLRARLASTVPWIDVGENLMLHHGGERFGIRVDPRELEAGQVHYGEVHGFDATAPERGPLFRLPVTVVRPVAATADGGRRWSESLRFAPGQVHRRFFGVPAGATWADLRVRPGAQEAPRLLIVQAVQLLPGRHFDDGRFEEWLHLEPQAEVVKTFAVTGGRTLELCLAQYWSSLGEGAYDVELTFHGLLPANEVVRMDGAKLMTRLDVTAPFARERLAPVVKLTTLRKRLRPSKSLLRPLDRVRDGLPDERLVHELILEYPIVLKKPAKVQPLSFLAESEDIYDEWSSSLWTIFDSNKRRVGKGPIWGKRTVALEKGTHLLRLHLRHDDPARLEAVRDAALFLDVKLGKPLSLPVFGGANAALAGRPRFEARDLERGARARVYVGSLAAKKLPELAEPGDELLGEITYGEADASRVGQGHRPRGYRVFYLVPPPPKPDEKEQGAEPKEEKKKPTLTEVHEAVRDLQVAKLAVLRKTKAFEDFDRLAVEILRRHPGHVPVLVEQLLREDGKGPPYAARGKSDRVLRRVACVLARIDRRRIAAYLGTKHEPKGAEAEALHARMTMRRDALVEALFRKARVLSDAAGGTAGTQAFHAAFEDLESWTDTKKGRYLALRVAYERSRGRLGAALEMLAKQVEGGKPTKALFEQRAKLYEELGWTHWAAYERNRMSIRFPPAYPPF